VLTAPEPDRTRARCHLQLAPALSAQQKQPDRLPIFFDLHGKHDFHGVPPFFRTLTPYYYLPYVRQQINSESGQWLLEYEWLAQEVLAGLTCEIRCVLQTGKAFWPSPRLRASVVKKKWTLQSRG
jgi:hypothetical protein